ncbi:MAG: c-type cytochrome [Verrucomicrobia bacterium]|nr:c-type cytochrome [Verrucomicrobiota bacterium]
MNTTRLFHLATLAALLAAAQPLRAQAPEWIWHDNKGKPTESNERRFFRKIFTVEGKVTKAVLTTTTDNEGTAFVNGKSVATCLAWERPEVADVTAEIKAGENILALRGINHGGAAATIARLEITFADGKKSTVVTDASWVSFTEDQAGWQQLAFKADGWTKVVSLGKLGVAPWNDVFGPGAGKGGAKGAAKGAAAARREATPAESLHTLPGFKVELIATAEPEEGSWVNLCKDNKGRLIVSPQYRSANPDGGLLRITLGANGKVTKREFIAKPLYDAQGMVWANNALYVVVNKYSTRFESGLYRISDPSGNDLFEDIQLLKRIPGGGEHGPHAVELGPDGKLYVIAGNHTKPVEGTAATSPHKNYAEDHVLPRQWDGNGHATGILAPGGYVYRTDLDGRNWEMFCAGFRNQYDFSFNADGEIFTYDSDMEWEWGMHWYRATRVYHCTSGADFGWRSGSGKWPSYYADGTPPTLDVGVGCPTGTKFGYGAKFPAKYQRAYYILDWTYGRILAVHLTPQGASYSATMENFICPKGLVTPGAPKPPLNVTDMEIGSDGAAYFTVGGRGVQAGLYRVTYDGAESTAPAPLKDTAGADARALRRRIEAFHGKADPNAVAFVWPHLNSDDRWIRYAARIALEAQPLTGWRQRALDERQTNAALTALMALARVGGKDSQDDSLKALSRFPLAQITETQQLEKLRVVQVSFARHGKPSPDVAKLAVEKLGAAYPSKSERVNRELCQLLVFLEAPGTAARTLALIDAAPTQEQQMAYLFPLRNLATGWAPEERRHYFTTLNGYPDPGAAHDPLVMQWFREAGRPYGDGNSFRKQLDLIRMDAAAKLGEPEKTQLASLINVSSAGGSTGRPAVSFPKPQQRTAVVKEWTMADFLPSLDAAAKERNWARGQQAFVDAQCLACHKMGNEGGGVGPDLTAVAARFTRRDVLESILEPSRVLSEQFVNTTFALKNGEDITGRVIDETGDKVVLYVNPFTQDRTEVKKSDIKARTPSKLSPMPEGLVKMLTKDEILDLLAFIEANGRRNHPVFAK